MSQSHDTAHPAVTLSIRISPESRDQLDELAQATGRSKSFLASEAIEQYLAIQAWQVNAIAQAVRKADSKEAQFVEHTKVSNWLKSWGNEDEQDAPK